MLSDFVDCCVVDHRHRLLADVQSIRGARASGSRPVRARAAALRSNIGFRLVEAGLRLALGRGEPELSASRSVR